MKFDIKKIRPADGPRKKEKSYRPPGVAARRAGVLAFWLMFAFMGLVVFATIANKSESAQEPQVHDVDENAAANTAGAEFAKAFATEYFNWEADAEGWEARKAALEPMLAAGLDEQAGLLLADQKWNSKTVSAQILKVQPAGDQKAVITVKVEQLLTNVEDPEKKERQRHTLAIPVAYDQALGVYDLPAFVALDQPTEAQPERLKGTAVETETQQNIKNFLATFFQSYTTDTPDKLAYFLEDPEATTGLAGSVTFEEVQHLEAVKGKKAGQYIVDAAVILRDAKTGTGFLSNYRLTITEKDGRYIVTKLNKGDE